VNESEWLAGEDPRAMLDSLRTGRADERQGASYPLAPCPVRVSARKLRLFACACCRLCWDRLDTRSREAVGCAEAWAGGATSDDRERADLAASTHTGCLADDPADAARQALVLSAARGVPPAAQAALLRDVCGSPFRSAAGVWGRCLPCGGSGSCGHTASAPDQDTRCPKCDGRGRTPLVPWLCPAVLALARAACSEGREVPCGRCGGEGKVFACQVLKTGPTDHCPDCKGTGRTSDGLLCNARLAVLADALEEAGCDVEGLLRHLRGQERAPPGWYRCRGCGREWKPAHKYDGCDGAACEGLEEPAEWIALRGPHVRGCWALDLLLGRA
jgi:hypothetical protein